MMKNLDKFSMFVPTVVMGVLAIALLCLGYYRGHGEHISGLKRGWIMTLEIMPLLLFAFIIAGMIQAFLPRETLSKWIGSESGMRGILIGAMAGGFMPGGPYVSLPLCAGLMRSGAGVGTMVAFLTAWSLWAVSRLPMEIGIMGWRFTLIRLVSTFFFPPIAGLIAQFFFGNPR